MIRAFASAMDPACDRIANAIERQTREPWFESDGAVAFDFIGRFGTLGAAGDRHLAEFVTWYLYEEETILAKGVPPTPFEWRERTWKAPRPTAAQLAATPLVASGEEGVAQMKALIGLGSLGTNLNLPNKGQWSQAPLGTVVETNISMPVSLLRAGGMCCQKKNIDRI